MLKDAKLILLLLILALIFTGCNTTQSFSPDLSNDSKTDYNEFIAVKGEYAVTKNSAYTIINNKLYYFDDNNDKWNLLCFDPSCKHDNNECSAYLDGTNQIFIYENFIYYLSRYIDNEFILYRMNLSGKQRERIKSIRIEETGAGVNYSYQISKNRILIRFHTMNTDKNLVSTKLYITTLDKSSDLKIIAQGDVNEFRVTKFWFFYSEKTGESGLYSLKAYNLETQEHITVFDDYTEAEKYIATIYTPDSDTFYWFQADKGFMMSHIDDMQHILLKQSDPTYQQGGAIYDNDYIFLVNTNPLLDKTANIPVQKRGLYIYGHDGECVDFIDISSIGGSIGYLFETENKVFFRTISLSFDIYYILKSDIGTGNIEWIPVE